MKPTHYEDKYFHYFRKPHGLASTFGKQKSFLDYFETDIEFKVFLESQKIFFSREEEYGLVNRLDNDTAGLLYFAKTPYTKEIYHQIQSEGKIKKHYLADVEGNLEIKHGNNPFIITSPIAHHRFKTDRMVVLNNDFGKFKIDDLLQKHENKIRGRLHEVKTQVTPLRYNEKDNKTTCSVIISKGIRHQIRAHLSSIGAPIIGEKIYTKKILSDKLCLWSIGLDF